MFKKIFKYDFMYLLKRIGFILAFLIITAAFARLSMALIMKTSFASIGVMFVLLSVVAIFAAPVVSIIIIIIRFTKNILKDEGYLMNTLPISKSHLFLSKVLTSLIFQILVYIFMALSVLILISSRETFQLIYDLYVNIFLAYFSFGKLTYFTTLLITYMLLSNCVIILVIMMCLTIGHSYPKNKIGYSILFAAVCYFINQMFGFVVSLVITFVSSNVTNIFTSMTLVLWVEIGAYCIFGVTSYFVGLRYLNRHINLE